MIRNFTTVFILFALLNLSVTSFGQTEKGNMILGGAIDLESTTFTQDNRSDQKTFSFNFNPAVSYLVVDNLAVGLVMPISTSKQTQDGYENRKSQSIAVGPKLRYYIPFDRLAVFPEISYTIGGGKLAAPYFDFDTGATSVRTEKYGLSNVSIGFGLSYFLNRNIAIESIVSYNKIKRDYDNNNTIDPETSTLAFDIGFQIYFQTKK